jgi:hypothetical protein
MLGIVALPTEGDPVLARGNGIAAQLQFATIF